ncbi:hypothetical protein [Kaistia adipata]|uniref:hypothetical protein n=1 Tax=Kaistia adipata TaxID=166954 RepID=UPI00040E2B44|nr:hypothetical protein [Kaistia adipata]
MNLQFGLAVALVVVAGFLLANKAGAVGVSGVAEPVACFAAGPPLAHAAPALR